MPFEVSSIVPVAGTLAAALVAGGIARANLIASKETKVSEFRQAWIDSLREDLAALFSNTRTVCRAMQEHRWPNPSHAELFNFPQARIVEARHAAGETFHRIRLRLNDSQSDHKELRRRLSAMMQATQDYIIDSDVPVSLPIDAVESAAQYAEVVLKSEWETVKRGESAYQSAVRMTKQVLGWSLVLLVILVFAVPIIAWYASSTEKPGIVAKEDVPVRAKPPSVRPVQNSAMPSPSTSASAKK
ncbi:hypothetical protein ACEN9H_25175 [Massilia cellulosiltytica]|uniref:hypothetical protein n=1 Tax=Massilia cellulosiltytica TaxID=2683234 RepID=UPI0039B4462B